MMLPRAFGGLGDLARVACWTLLIQFCVAQSNLSFPPLLDATLDELRDGLDAGSFTSVDLVNAYLGRINETNDHLRAVVEINPDAVDIATELDALRQSGVLRGPLHGIPVLVKDNIATNDKMNNTAGSYALVGAKVPRDSTVIAKLRRAGAIILGKTNLSQWASARSKRGSEGWSAYGGQTIGAYFPGQDPSGSSSGSGVASSIGLAWACLGTETGGSIIHPSSIHNLVGVKPTVGLTSRYLVVPLSEHQDTVGPMARTVKDAAALLTAIVGRDTYDNYTSAIPFTDTPDYLGACVDTGLRGKRLGVPRHILDDLDDKTMVGAMAAFNETLDVLRSAGAVVVDDLYLPGYDLIRRHRNGSLVAGADFMSDIPKYFGLLEENPANISSVAELREFTHNHPLEDYPNHDTVPWDEFLKRGMNNTSPGFWGNYTAMTYYAGELGLTGALRNYTLDALVLPASPITFLSSIIGGPIITVPMGRTADDAPVLLNDAGELNETAPNQPFGLGFAGAHFSEEALIGMAYAFEQRTLVRKQITPLVLPTTELADVVAARRGSSAVDDWGEL